MVKVVSFDYFPIAEIFDFGFTKTDPWSWNFEYLDYGSLNFIENLGSIIVFMWIGIIFFIAVIVLSLYRRKSKLRHPHCLKKRCRPFDAWYTALGFLQGTFFEIIVSLSVGMKILELHGYLNASDKFSLAHQFMVFVVMTILILLITIFTIFYIPKLRALSLIKLFEERGQRILKV